MPGRPGPGSPERAGRATAAVEAGPCDRPRVMEPPGGRTAAPGPLAARAAEEVPCPPVKPPYASFMEPRGGLRMA